MVRYYNICAADGSAPAIAQTARIASIPVASGTSYVDWLGDPGGTTQYKVTAVDTQGNESGALSVTYAAKATPGQYDVGWTGEVAPAGPTKKAIRIPGGMMKWSTGKPISFE